MEILSPAGSFESLKAAVFSGADAVYFGNSDFNARANAQNFTKEQIYEGIRFCHERGVKCHAVLNTLITDREISKVLSLAEFLANGGIDAFILQDIGLASLLKNATDIPLHASTQMTIHNLDGVNFAADFGFSRVVLSRELSKENISCITHKAPKGMEIEVFAHGALCICYSGQCYMSSVIGQRSGNRGQCAQPCRLPYKEGYTLSLKDLSLLKYVKELETMGVSALKIEGRMKSPEYVAAVTSKYAAAKKGMEYAEEDEKMLAEIFSRNGFTDGYYKGEYGKKMFGVKSETTSSYKIPAKEYKRLGISFKVKQIEDDFDNIKILEENLQDNELELDKENKIILISAITDDGYTSEQKVICQSAKNNPVTKEQIENSLSRLGDTIYHLNKIEIDLKGNLFIAVSILNNVRRNLLNKIVQMRLLANAKFKMPLVDLNKGKNRKYPTQYRGFFLNPENIPENADSLEKIWLPLQLFKTKKGKAAVEKWRNKIGAVLPRIFHDNERKEIDNLFDAAINLGIRDILVGNVGHIQYCKEKITMEKNLILHGDYGLNIYNQYSAGIFKEKGLDDSILSFELNFPQLKDIVDDNSGIISYGRLPFMIMRNCVKKQHNKNEFLTDRMKKEFLLTCDFGCRNSLWNADKLYIADKDLSNFHFCQLIFTDETKEGIAEIIDEYVLAKPFLRDNITRGLYNK